MKVNLHGLESMINSDTNSIQVFRRKFFQRFDRVPKLASSKNLLSKMSDSVSEITVMLHQ